MRKNSKIIFLALYAGLILGAGYIFFTSYIQYDYLKNSAEYTEFMNQLKEVKKVDTEVLVYDRNLRINEQKTIMIISFLVGILSPWDTVHLLTR